MGIILRVLLGAAILAVGVGFVWKTRDIYAFFGSVPFAEKYLGGGGSTLFYKLLGVLFCFIGFIVMFNLWDAFLQATIGSLFPRPS